MEPILSLHVFLLGETLFLSSFGIWGKWLVNPFVMISWDCMKGPGALKRGPGHSILAGPGRARPEPSWQVDDN